MVWNGKGFLPESSKMGKPATVCSARVVQNFGKQHFYMLVLLLYNVSFLDQMIFTLFNQPFTKNMCMLYVKMKFRLK